MLFGNQSTCAAAVAVPLFPPLGPARTVFLGLLISTLSATTAPQTRPQPPAENSAASANHSTKPPALLPLPSGRTLLLPLTPVALVVISLAKLARVLFTAPAAVQPAIVAPLSFVTHPMSHTDIVHLTVAMFPQIQPQRWILPPLSLNCMAHETQVSAAQNTLTTIPLAMLGARVALDQTAGHLDQTAVEVHLKPAPSVRLPILRLLKAHVAVLRLFEQENNKMFLKPCEQFLTVEIHLRLSWIIYRGVVGLLILGQCQDAISFNHRVMLLNKGVEVDQGKDLERKN
jgi:hypothetical protein